MNHITLRQFVCLPWQLCHVCLTVLYPYVCFRLGVPSVVVTAPSERPRFDWFHHSGVSTPRGWVTYSDGTREVPGGHFLTRPISGQALRHSTGHFPNSYGKCTQQTSCASPQSKRRWRCERPTGWLFFCLCGVIIIFFFMLIIICALSSSCFIRYLPCMSNFECNALTVGSL